jgi:hypothetical integral membrane protein (TIGR02206 family)
MTVAQLFGHNSVLYPFAAFSLAHWTMLAVFAAGSFALYAFRAYLGTHEKAVRGIFFSGLLVLESLYHYWLYNAGVWDVSFTLPLQLCSISLILCLILLASGSRLIFQIVYFIGIAGALMAVLTPELFFGFPHFRYFQFFITHILIIWTCLYFVLTKRYAPTHKGMWLSFLFLNISAGIAYLANKWTGGNYMFLAYKPSNGSLIDFLGPYPYYIAALEGIALIIFYLLLLPFAVWNRK